MAAVSLAHPTTTFPKHVSENPRDMGSLYGARRINLNGFRDHMMITRLWFKFTIVHLSPEAFFRPNNVDHQHSHPLERRANIQTIYLKMIC